MNDESLLWPLRDARKARKGGAAEIAQRQRARLAEAVVPRPCRLALPQLQLRARMASRHTDWVIFEPVDANYQPVAPGENSHTVLISDLANRAQPILRYDLGDSVLQRPDPCPCGCPLPAIPREGPRRRRSLLRPSV